MQFDRTHKGDFDVGTYIKYRNTQQLLHMHKFIIQNWSLPANDASFKLPDSSRFTITKLESYTCTLLYVYMFIDITSYFFVPIAIQRQKNLLKWYLKIIHVNSRIYSKKINYHAPCTVPIRVVVCKSELICPKSYELQELANICKTWGRLIETQTFFEWQRKEAALAT